MLCCLPPGGHDPSWRGLKAVELYDPVQDSWKLGPMLPSALPFAGAGVATKGQVYIIGGGEHCASGGPAAIHTGCDLAHLVGKNRPIIAFTF
jgi:hypothetical protein